MKAYEKVRTARPDEEKELAECRRKVQNCAKSIADGLDFPELRDEVDRLRLRISELENALSVPKGVTLTRDMIIEQNKFSPP